jgi:transketolase
VSSSKSSPYRHIRPEILSLLNSEDLFSKTRQQPTRYAYAEALLELGEQNADVVVLDADVSKSVRTNEFASRFPERSFNFGIAEQNMMAAAAGMATTGLIPYATTYAVFASMRALDQVRNSIHYPRLNVKIAASHGGITPGPDGVTHQGQEDLSILRAIANSTISSTGELFPML